ncbi:hypothetical protein SLA2020_315050 [Shorea laevis]
MVVVVVTAASTFTIVALLFFCYLKVKGNKNKISPKEEHRDGAPFLDLSDFSGSPQQSISLGNSNNKYFCIDSIQNLSAKLDNHDSSLAEVKPLEAIAGTPSLPSLKPPPGGLAPPLGLCPPPPSKACLPMPPKSKLAPPAPHRQENSASSEPSDESGVPKTKLKPFF